MEPVLTPEEMVAADEATIEAGAHAFELMDRAAFACAVVAMRKMSGAHGRRVVVVAGKGNNGGDGIAAAGHLAAAGASVSLLLLSEPAGDPARHLEQALLRTPAGRVRTQAWSSAAFDDAVHGADLVIDAIFGTGFAGEPRGAAAEAISILSASSAPVVSVDMPSGVSGADGAVAGPAVRADDTVALQALKVGHVTGPGAWHCGRIHVADIGILPGAASVFLPSGRDVRAVLPRRAPDTHKYATGVLAVLAGSSGMTGAAILCLHAAIRSGAGLVFAGVPRPSLPVVEQAVVEAVKEGLSDADGQLDAKSFEEFVPRLQQAKALAVGPGIGRGPRAEALVRCAVDTPIPLLLDADALTALAAIMRDDPDVLHRRAAPTVLTPHAGEYARLAGRSAAPRSEERIARARRSAQHWGAIVHLKGRRAVTVGPQQTVWVNPTGGPGMATAGTGDVLTGVIGTLLAQGLSGEDATWAGALVHGLAGDIAAGRVGERPLRATDVLDALPAAFAHVERSPGPPDEGTIRVVVEPA